MAPPPAFTLRSNTPHSVTWEVSSLGGAASLPLNSANPADQTILKDCAPGPLKAWLEAQQGVSWAAAEDDPRTKDVLRVYLAHVSGRSPASVYFDKPAAVNKIVVEADNVEAPFDVYVTLQYEHSADR